ncbi:MAG: precorrin-6A/cobalt-precorrin-6A reductase [Cyanobacteriota bacterium]
MHAPPLDGPAPGAGRIWLIAGTGEGPPLAKLLLARGWRLRVSVVTPGAAASYPGNPDLEVLVGDLAGAEAWRQGLEQARRQGDPFQWIIDVSHPFATRVSAAAALACEGRPEQLLRLHRPLLNAPKATPLDHLHQIGHHLAEGERLLLAIGARHLGAAIGHSPRACHHSRVLPHPRAIQQALQAGLAAHRLACCQPTRDGAVEQALCLRWGIETLVCRQSGSRAEALWLRISEELGLRLLLLRRPPEPAGVARLTLPALIDRIGWPG